MSFVTLRTFCNRYTIFLPLTIVLYCSYLNTDFYFDDPLIYARYIQNFLNGHGLVYNIGERFNGLTSPFYTYLTLTVSTVSQNILNVIILESTLFLAITVAVFHKLFATYINNYFAIIGSLVLATSPYPYVCYGMETFLFTALIGGVIYLFLKENYFQMFILLAILVLTRNEGVFLALAIAIEHIRLKRNLPKLKHLIIPSIIVAAHFSLNISYYGALLPASGPAKIWQGQSGLWDGGWPLFFSIHIRNYFLNNYFSSSLPLVYTMSLFVVLGIYNLGRNSFNIVSIIFLILYTSFYVFLNIPNYYWYDAPLMVFFFYYFGVGVFFVYQKIKTAKVPLANIAAVVFAVTLTSFPVILNVKSLNLGVIDPVRADYKDIGLWLKNKTPRDASIAMVEIGIVGYYSERRIIDIMGLVIPLNAKFIGERRFDEFLNHYSPDYLLVHWPIWKHAQGVKNKINNGEYLDYLDFNFDGYKLLARNDLDISSNQLKKITYRQRRNTFTPGRPFWGEKGVFSTFIHKFINGDML